MSDYFATKKSESDNKIQKALEARKKRMNALTEKKEYSDGRIQAALESRNRRVQSSLPGILSGIDSLLTSEIDSYNSVKPSFGSYDDKYKSQRERRISISKLRTKVNAYRKYMDNGVADNILSALDDMEKGYDAHLALAKFDSKEDYDKYVQAQKDYEDQLNLDLEEAAKEIAQLESYLKDYEYLTRWQQDEAGQQREAEYRRKYGDVGALKALIGQKRQYLEQAEKLQNFNAKSKEYASLMGTADFAKMSKYVPQKRKEQRPIDVAMGNYSNEASGWDDPLYEYINGNQDAGAYLSNQASDDYGGEGLAAIFGRASDSKAESQRMTKDEVAIFNYLYATQGKDAAHAYYYDHLRSELNARQREHDTQYWANYAKEDPFGSSVFSVITSPLKGLSYAGQATDFITTGKIDQNAGYNQFSYTNSAIRNQVSQQIENSGKWGKVGSFLYQTGMSMGDFVMSTAVSGGNQTFALAIMGTGSAADTTIAAKDRGLSDGQAFALGTIAGAAEVLMEKVSLDTLFNADLLANGTLKYVLKNALAEGGEEIGTDLINTLADVLIAQDKSQWQMAIDAYVAEGKSESEAFGLALANKALELGLSGLGGALSGSVMSGVGATINHMSSSAHTQQLYGTSQQESVTEALEINPDNVFAKKMQSKLEGGKNLSGSQLNKLVQQNEAAIKKQGTTAENVAVPDAVKTKQIATEMGAESTPATSASVSSQVQSHASEGVYEASEDGKTYFKDEPVDIVGVASVKDSGMKLKLEDGRVVDAQEVQYGSADEAVVYETVASLGVHALGANMLIENYTPGGNVTAKVYAKGIEEAYKLGQMNVPQSELATMPFASELAEYQRQAAYQLGELFGGKQTAKEQATARKNRNAEGTDTSKGRVHFDGDRNSLNKTQKASMDAIEVLAKTLGVQIYVFESEVGSDGKRKGVNGWYDPSDGSIHIDLYAGSDGKGTMLFTAAHELTHFIRQWSPAKFKALANVLMKQYGQQSVSVNELVQNQIDKAKRGGREISYDTAYEEVVADSMETMLADGSIIEMMAELKQQDKTLWAKTRDWFKDLAGKLRAVVEAYKGVRPDSVEGRLAADMQDMIGTLEALYMDALADASENYNAGAQKNTANEGGGVNGPKYSVREGMTDAERYEKLKNEKIVVHSDEKSSIYSEEIENLAALSDRAKSKAEKIIIPLAKKLGILGRAMTAKDVDVDFIFSKNNGLTESISKQLRYGGNYVDFAKTLTNLDEVINSAVLIEVHGDKYAGTVRANENLQAVYVLFGAFRDGKNIIPVQMEIKKSSDAGGRLYLTVALTKIEADVLGSTPDKSQTHSLISASKYSLTDLFSKINPKDKHFLKYLPDGFLNEEQLKAKMAAIKEDEARIAGYKKKFSQRDSVGNQLSMEQQEFFKNSQVRLDSDGEYWHGEGRLVPVYHATDAEFTTFLKKYIGRSTERNAFDTYLLATAYVGFWFNTTDPVAAGKMSGQSIKVYLNAKRLYDAGTLEGLANEIWDIADGTTSPKRAAKNFTDSLKWNGYDGIVIRDEEMGGISFAVFDSNQIKDVKNTAPTPKRDILRSDRDPDYQKVNKVLEQENAKLKEDVSYLKELVKIQRTVTGGKKFTKSSVEAAVQYLKQNANAKGDTKELAGLLNSLYEHIASAEDLTWESVREQAQPAVDWLQSHVDTKSKRSEYVQDILNQLHGSRVYLDESQMAEAAFRFGSYNDYRRLMMGSITLAKDADTSLDSLWQEFSALYPDVFDSETTSTDMPGALADIIHRLRNSDTTALEYARNREMIAQDLLQQVYDSYWRVSTLYTVADVKQREINRLKGEHFQRMNRLKEQHRENVEKLKQEHKERLEKVRQDYRDRADAKIEKITQKYQESRKKGIEGRRKTEMRHKIQKVVKKLNDLLLNETKDRHVPDSLKKAVAEALDAINMDTVGADERIAKYDDLIAKATDPDVIATLTETRDRIAKSGERLADRIGKLKTAYDSIKTGADSASISVYDEVIAKKIQEVVELVGSTALRDMSYEQLEAVYEMYTMVAKSISNANRSFKEARGATITEMGNSAIREVKAAGGSNQYALKALENTKKFGWDLLKPYYAFSLIGSDTLSKLYNNVRKGEDVWATDVQSARQFFRQQAEKYGYDDWDLRKEYTFTDVSGREFKVGLPQIMSLYAYSKRAQADKHLEKGGFVFDSAVEVVQKKGGIPVKYRVNTANAYNLNRMQINEIVDTLSEEQIAFVDAMQDYLSTVMGEKGNEVSLALYDVRLFKEKNYFPLKSASQYTFQQTENTGEVKLKNSGFSKKTVVNASNPIILSDFMNVWGGHVNDMSMYHAFVLPLEDFNRVYNYKTLTSEETSTQSVKAALQNAYGIASTKYIKQMLEDINGGARTDDRASILSRWMGKFKKGSVFANASVVIQQPSAIARAAALIDLQHFIGPKISQKRHKQLWDEVKQYAPVAIIKEMGYFDTNMGLSTVEYLTAKEYETIGDKAKAMFVDGNYRDEVLSRPAALADELSWCYIWEAVKRETRGNNPGMDVMSEQFLKKAGERFTEVVTRTQVYDSVLSRSGLMRSKDTGAKMMTAFMSEPTTSMNMVFDALVQGKRGNRWYTRNAIGAVVASQILNSLLVSIVYAARDDDEDKTYLEKYIANFTAKTLDSLNPLSYLPFIKDIVSITRGYTVERSDMSVISDIWAAWQKLPNEKVSVYRKIEDFGGSIAQAFGVPVKNIMRDIRSIWQTTKSFISGPETTATGIGTAIQEEVTGDSVPKHKQLYDAIVKGDVGHQERIAATYEDETALEGAIRRGLREFDARISEAAESRYYGDFDEYERIFGEIEKEGHFTHSQIAGAVQAEINDMDENEGGSSTPKNYGMYSIDDFMLAVNIGNSVMAGNIREEIIRIGQENGKSAEKSKDSFVSSAVSACKERYLSGELSKDDVIGLLTEYCDRSKSEAQANISYWEYRQEKPNTEASAQWFDTYYEKLQGSGIDVDTYVEYRNQKSDYTRKDDILEVIDGLSLTDDQKDALYFAEGWAESTLDEAPWH